MQVICFSGHARHGKDTSAEYLADYLRSAGKRVLIVHYGDLVKFTCKLLFDWNGEKDEQGRTLLQNVGTNCVRSAEPDYWCRYLTDMIGRFFPYCWDYVLIPDARFPNEISCWTDAGIPVLHYRVLRYNADSTEFDNGLTPSQKEHPSETALDDVKADRYIHNFSTLDELRRYLCSVGMLLLGEHDMTLQERRYLTASGFGDTKGDASHGSGTVAE